MNFGGSGALSRRLGIHDSESQESKTEDYSPNTTARMRALLSLPEVDECLAKPTLKADAAGDEEKRKMLRRERNREHAVASRKRKKERLDNLEQENEELRRHERKLVAERDDLFVKLQVWRRRPCEPRSASHSNSSPLAGRGSRTAAASRDDRANAGSGRVRGDGDQREPEGRSPGTRQESLGVGSSRTPPAGDGPAREAASTASLKDHAY